MLEVLSENDHLFGRMVMVVEFDVCCRLLSGLVVSASSRVVGCFDISCPWVVPWCEMTWQSISWID